MTILSFSKLTKEVQIVVMVKKYYVKMHGHLNLSGCSEKVNKNPLNKIMKEMTSYKTSILGEKY